MSKHKRSRRHIVATTLSAVGLTIAGVFGIAAPASAAPSGCGAGDGCLYSGYNYSNDVFQNFQMLRFFNCIDRLQDYNYREITSSFFNNGFTQGAYLYEGNYANGSRTFISRGTGVTDLGTRSWNDRASSAYFSSQIQNRYTSVCA